MPTYCFEATNGDCIHGMYDIKHCPETITVAGRVYRKNAVCPNTESRAANCQAQWPIHSESLAVHPSQIAEATEFARRRGCPTNFDHHGRPELTSQWHRRKYLKIQHNNYFDKKGYD